jgi:hypothetical protein
LTQINFDFGHPSADGVAVLAGELVHVVPTGRFKVGKRIVVRDFFDVRLSETGTATVDVTPTDNTFAYEVTVGESPDAWRFVRCVQVPNSSTPVAFADLVDVDASTLAPAPNSGTALTYLLPCPRRRPCQRRIRVRWCFIRRVRPRRWLPRFWRI